MNRDKPVLRVQMVCMKETENEAVDFVKFWHNFACQIGLIRARTQRTNKKDQNIMDYDKFIKPCHQLFSALL